METNPDAFEEETQGRIKDLCEALDKILPRERSAYAVTLLEQILLTLHRSNQELRKCVEELERDTKGLKRIEEERQRSGIARIKGDKP